MRKLTCWAVANGTTANGARDADKKKRQRRGMRDTGLRRGRSSSLRRVFIRLRWNGYAMGSNVPLRLRIGKADFAGCGHTAADFVWAAGLYVLSGSRSSA